VCIPQPGALSAGGVGASREGSLPPSTSLTALGLAAVTAATAATLLLWRSTTRALKTGLWGAGAAALLTAAPASLAVELVAGPAGSPTAQPAASMIARIAEGEPLTTFYGLDTPPTSYGGYGGNANEAPRYKFQYPQSWKPQTVNKTMKGVQGIDAKIVNPKNKQEQCFAITLARAGEDLGFRITNVESTFAGFAGADYEIADSLQNAEQIIEGKREVDGQPFFDYDIVAESRYLATVTVQKGKVYAFFIKAPNELFEANGATYRAMRDSFTTIADPADLSADPEFR